MQTKKYLYLIPITLYLFFVGCKKDLTPVDNTPLEIKLTVEDVGVTEVWFRLNIQNSNSKNQITITRNDSTIQSRTTGPSALDTLIYDSGLLPNHNYTYTATLTTDSRTLTAESQITTMDTTNHDFTWQSWTFGAKGSSILYDVAIINENNIWAVGEIYTEDTYTYDSLGNWIQPYNAMHWDGSEWELKRLMIDHSSFYKPHPIFLESVFAFAEDDIWFSTGNLHHYCYKKHSEDSVLTSYYLWDMGVLDSTDGGIKKIWGTSSNDLYGVGDKGTIVHFNGRTWHRIESGTQNNLHDIWGIYNEEIDEKSILITARNKILKITNDNVIEEFNWPFGQNSTLSIWFKNQFLKFTCGDGVFKYSKTNGWKMFSELPNYKTYHIRGNDINDVFVAGAFGYVAHYNGINWKEILPIQNVRYGSMSLTNNLTAIVGYDFNSSPVKAIVTVLTKN